MKNIFIIVAGGSGVRMNTPTPKQFIEVNGKTILHHTLDVFHNYDSAAKIILVLPENRIIEWQELIKHYSIIIPHIIIPGGSERFFSVKNAIESIEDENAIISIHDGVRPLVSVKTINNCINAAKEHNGAIPVIELKESIRHVEGENHNTVNRNNFKLVQTPQCFKLSIIKNAYLCEYQSSFTDDASVVENYGVKVKLVEGNYENIKITTHSDLIIAAALLKNNKS